MPLIEKAAEIRAPAELVASLEGRKGLAWLDGDGSSGDIGRWSYVACEPRAVLRAPWGAKELWRWTHALESARARERTSDPRTVVDGTLDAQRVPRWIGFVGYDFAWSGAFSEWTQPRLARRNGGDVVWFGEYAAVLAYDHTQATWWIVADDREAAARLLAATHIRGRAASSSIDHVRASSAFRHAKTLCIALDHIARGNIYQVNLARRWRGHLLGSPLSLAQRMREASAVPLGVFLDTHEQAVIGRSMELFLDWNRSTGRLETRPIKGTIARRGTDDRAEAAVLRADPKERAEHAMIVDLMRNDLGRVAQTGSVRVRNVMRVEPYAKLHHLVSTVECVTRDDVSIELLLRATFPPGSVTGTPKVRAVEIIEDLETSARGVYTGCYGYVDRAGGLRLAVAIRTATVGRRSGDVDYFAGGGIVEASVPAYEVAETELKARVFLDALVPASCESDATSVSMSSRVL